MSPTRHSGAEAFGATDDGDSPNPGILQRVKRPQVLK
eukprot:XP_001708118.1 Hypothetical protein GL50803_115670 [Giardia lamblia ATCC 50803]